MGNDNTAGPDAPAANAFVHQAASDWRQCRLDPGLRRLLDYAEKLTRSPAACTQSDIMELRQAGWSDRALHDAVQVVAYFNYINRVADGLGVESERDLPRWGHGPG